MSKVNSIGSESLSLNNNSLSEEERVIIGDLEITGTQADDDNDAEKADNLDVKGGAQADDAQAKDAQADDAQAKDAQADDDNDAEKADNLDVKGGAQADDAQAKDAQAKDAHAEDAHAEDDNDAEKADDLDVKCGAQADDAQAKDAQTDDGAKKAESVRQDQESTSHCHTQIYCRPYYSTIYMSDDPFHRFEVKIRLVCVALFVVALLVTSFLTCIEERNCLPSVSMPQNISDVSDMAGSAVSYAFNKFTAHAGPVLDMLFYASDTIVVECVGIDCPNK